MTKVNLIHLGIGNVGREVVRQIASQRAHLYSDLDININYCGMFSSQYGIFNKNGLSNDDISSFPSNSPFDPSQAIADIPAPFVVIDTTSSDNTQTLLQQALTRGGFVVTANKRPLTSTQNDYDELFGANHSHIFFEATVGAGLPVIGTLQNLINAGDKIESITGCFSGSLGYIFSELESGSLYSQAVSKAKAQGFTEHDPRDDLSGADVARKAIILARTIGFRLEPQSVILEDGIPLEMGKLSINEFMRKIPQLDADYTEKLRQARQHGSVLRYVATVTANSCTIGLTEVPAISDIGSLKGPDNIIVIRSKRYHDNPLVIKGPGAGISVTAAAVFADSIKVAQLVKGCS